LLEVLVSCGILVLALASIAAVLPAAGSRLGEAAALDRAAAAAAAAMAQVQARGLAAKDAFPRGAGMGANAPVAVFGEMLSVATTASATSAGYVTTTGALALSASTGNLTLVSGSLVPVSVLFSGTGPSAAAALITGTTFLAERIDSGTSAVRRGFFIEDEILFRPADTGDLSANSFLASNGTMNTGTAMARQFNRGVCWGLMLTRQPPDTPAATMTALKASIAVFKKPGGQVSAITLTDMGNGIFITAAASAAVTPVSLQRSLLKPCSMVLAIPPSSSLPATAPQWLSIRSSWIATGGSVGVSGTSTSAAITSSGTGRTCVSFANAVPSSLLSSGTTLNVIGFENLLLVNEKVFPAQ
jgi:hypothetical protein